MRSAGTGILILLAGLAGISGAQEGGRQPASPVSVVVEPREAGLAQALVVTIRVETSQDRTYLLPLSLDLSPFVELKREHIAESAAGQRLDVFRLTVCTYLETGELTLPGFRLLWKTADGEAESDIEIPDVKVKILSMLAGIEDPKARDLAGPIPVMVEDYRLLVYLGLGLMWLLAALVLRRQPSGLAGTHRLIGLPPARTAHEIAQAKLNAVVEDDLLRQGRCQEYFIRISEALREYLGNRYGFYALDLTSRELLEELRDRPTQGLSQRSLQRILEDADLVKFARLSPSDEMASLSLNGAFELVNKTKLSPAGEET